jgi:hypothetical protein
VSYSPLLADAPEALAHLHRSKAQQLALTEVVVQDRFA